MRTSQWKDDKFVEREPNTTTWVFDLEVLTPIFGGGVEIDGTKKPIDPRTPIRVSAIRGQLRFWWRATNPAECTTVDELRIAEKRLFGAATSEEKGSGDSGRLTVSISNQPKEGTTKSLPVFEDRNVSKGKGGSARMGIPYGAFALRDTERFTNHGTLTELTTRLELHISLPKNDEHERQLARTLWAWANFGGIGGRTRRGFGSIHLVPRTGVPSHVTFDLKKGWEEYSGTFTPRPWPTLPRDFEFAVAQRKCSESSGVEALELLLQKLQRLRQGVEIGRSKGHRDPKRPGRSYWPEPDSVRKIRGTNHPDHKTPQTRTNEFPRAAFGTPLIIQFGKDGEGKGEPTSSTINPTGKKRLASPLVLRVARGPGGELVLRALRLAHPKPADGFTLSWGEGNRKREQPVNVEVTNPRFSSTRQESPLIKNGREFIDPIARFFEELKQ